MAFSLSPLCLNVNAQTSGNKKQTKIEKREIQKFADSFFQNLEETKDLDQVPERFFVADFKTRFAKNEELGLDVDEEIESELIDAERYQLKSLMLNFFYLGVMWNGGGEKFFLDQDSDNDKDDSEEILPSQVVELINKNKTLCHLFDEDDCIEYKIKNADELRNSMIDLKVIVELQRKYVVERAPEWKSNFAKNMKKARKQFDYGDYSSELCVEDNCKGLPEKPRIFVVSAFPFFLQIIKENDEFKILNIFPYSQ